MGKINTKYTNEFVKDNLIKKGFLLLSTYKKSGIPVKLKHLICNYEWEVSWNSIQQGSGCPKCAKVAPIVSELAQLEATKKDIILKEPVVKSNLKISVVCAKCAFEWKTPWNRIQQNYGCPRCNCHKRITIDHIKSEMIKSGIIINSNNYKNAFTHLLAQCVKSNHNWQVTWTSLQQGSRCPICSSTKSKPEQELFEFVKNLYPDSLSRARRVLSNKRFELDIYIPSLKKAIEFDGPRHEYGHILYDPTCKDRDSRKSKECEEEGIELIRISYKDYGNKSKLNPIYVLICIKAWLEQ